MTKRRAAIPPILTVLVLSACVGVQADPSTSQGAAPPSGSGAPSGPAATPIAPGDTFTIGSLEATLIQNKLEVPWDLAFTPDGRMLVTERPGRLRVYASPEPSAELLSQQDIPEVRAEGESGAMGIAIDKDFENHPYAYVCASRDADGEGEAEPWLNELLRYRIGDGGDVQLDPEPLVTGMRAAVNHNGCAVETDADGHIWMTMGDANSVRNLQLSQDPRALNGKLMRLNRDGSAPDDNPILPGATEPTIAYSFGHRNPQGIAMRDDGVILVPEHGTDRDDEINWIQPAANFGYGCFTGDGIDGPALEQDGRGRHWCDDFDEFLPPVWASGFPTIAVSNAIFLTGEQWGDWEGDLIVSTLKEADLRRFEVTADGDSLEVEMVQTLIDDEFRRLRATVQAPDGSLYITSAKGVSDVIVRLEPVPEGEETEASGSPAATSSASP